MKKAFCSILAILLTLAMLGMFSACKETEDPVVPETSEEVVDTEPVDVVTELPSTDDVTEPAEDVTDEVTEAPAEADVKTPDQMNKEELVKYLNGIIDGTREAKPAYKRVSVKKIDSVNTTFIGGMLDSIVNKLVKDKMPGDPETHNQEKGKKNDDQIFGPNSKGSVRASDVSSINAEKSGDGYVLTVKLGKETNPTKDGNSKYSRLLSIATRQDVLDEIKDTVTADPDKATLTYHGGKLVITVDAEGRVTKLSEEFFVDADAKGVKASIITTDLVAKQSTRNEYSNFVY